MSDNTNSAVNETMDVDVLIIGGGSAGLGIARLIFQAMLLEGCSEEEVRRRFYIVDVDGLAHTKLFHLEG